MFFRISFLLLALLIAPNFTGAQTGLFLTVPCDRQSERFVVQADNKKVCITPQPLVPLDGFQSLGPLVVDTQQIYFDITFTQASFISMNGIIAHLSNTSFVLFINGEAIVVIPFEDVKNRRLHRFTAPLSGYFFIESQYAKLRAMMDENKLKP